jgi:hypothetical protein
MGGRAGGGGGGTSSAVVGSAVPGGTSSMVEPPHEGAAHEGAARDGAVHDGAGAVSGALGASSDGIVFSPSRRSKSKQGSTVVDVGAAVGEAALASARPAATAALRGDPFTVEADFTVESDFTDRLEVAFMLASLPDLEGSELPSLEGLASLPNLEGSDGGLDMSAVVGGSCGKRRSSAKASGTSAPNLGRRSGDANKSMRSGGGAACIADWTDWTVSSRFGGGAGRCRRGLALAASRMAICIACCTVSSRLSRACIRPDVEHASRHGRGVGQVWEKGSPEETEVEEKL